MKLTMFLQDNKEEGGGQSTRDRKPILETKVTLLQFSENDKSVTGFVDPRSERWGRTARDNSIDLLFLTIPCAAGLRFADRIRHFHYSTSSFLTLFLLSTIHFVTELS